MDKWNSDEKMAGDKKVILNFLNQYNPAMIVRSILITLCNSNLVARLVTIHQDLTFGNFDVGPIDFKAVNKELRLTDCPGLLCVLTFNEEKTVAFVTRST